MKKRPNRLAEALKEVNSVLEQSAKVILSSEDPSALFSSTCRLDLGVW